MTPHSHTLISKNVVFLPTNMKFLLTKKRDDKNMSGWGGEDSSHPVISHTQKPNLQLIYDDNVFKGCFETTNCV